MNFILGLIIGSSIGFTICSLLTANKITSLQEQIIKLKKDYFKVVKELRGE